MKLLLISASEASAVLRGQHYLGGLEYPPEFCFASEARDAVATFSPPVAQHFKVKLKHPLELTRLWQSQARRETGSPLSQFLGACLRELRKLATDCDCVLSYADPHLNHKGTIYRATNFECFGASRATDYWIDRHNLFAEPWRESAPKMYRRHKTKSREKLAAVGYELESRPPKILYVYGLRKTAAEVRQAIGGRYEVPTSGSGATVPHNGGTERSCHARQHNQTDNLYGSGRKDSVS